MTAQHTLLSSRRQVIGGAAAAGLLASAPSSRAAMPLQHNAAPAYYRFPLGDAEITVVSDGIVISGDPKKTFKAPPEDVTSLLSRSFLATDKVVFDENALVVNTGGKLVLFDTGMGRLKAFGKDAGKLFANLAAAGIDPAGIDAVVLTHGHADHICGVMIQDRLMFPNAQFYINQVDHDFWLDPGLANTGLKIFHDQALLNLKPIRDRITFIKDGEEFLPGIQAILAPGHTPGHMMFMITSAGKKLACLADLARHHILNVETPRWEFVGDIDPKLCVDTRIKLFDMVIQENIPVISYHYPFPGVGNLAKWGDRYRYYPAGWLEPI